MSKYIPLRFNRYQALSHVNFATRNTHICGRGVGKTTNIGWIMHNVITDMPRSVNALVCRTYLQALTRTLPAVIDGLEKFGYQFRRDYLVGKEPPKSWARPYFPPLSYEHFISFPNGAGYHLVSQDRKGTARGFNLDSWIGDEGLNLIKQMLDDEISVANRGNLGRFAHSRYHHSETIVSSQPILPESKWLLEASQYYRIGGQDYEDYRNELVDILLNIVDSTSEEEMDHHWSQARKLKQEFKFYRHTDIIPVTNEKLTSFFIDADVFDNIENLGWKYIRQQRASMSDLTFRVEILNAIFTISEKGFYPDLSERHLYDIADYSAYDELIYSPDAGKSITSILDTSIDKRLPIHISCDYGGSFNCLIASQEYADEERLVSEFYAYHPEKMENVVNQFINYFASHPKKEVHFWYDQTAIGTSGLVEFNYADEVMRLLRHAGWDVRPHYVGAAPPHPVKYQFIGKVLSERDPSLPRVRMHRENCRSTYNSMRMVAIKQGKTGFEKDKSPERKASVDQAKAPHLSDAFDQLIYHKHSDKQSGGSEWSGGAVGL